MKQNQAELQSCRENGYLLLQNVIDEAMLTRLRETIERFVERARELKASNAMFDIDPSGGAQPPRLRPQNGMSHA